MNIEELPQLTAAVYGYVWKGKPFFGVAMDDVGNHRRIIPLKSGTAAQAGLHALDYALSAIPANSANILIVTNNKYVVKVLETTEDGYKMVPEKNVDLVQAVRDKAAKRNVAVVYDADKHNAMLNDLKDNTQCLAKNLENGWNNLEDGIS